MSTFEYVGYAALFVLLLFLCTYGGIKHWRKLQRERALAEAPETEAEMTARLAHEAEKAE